MSRSTQPLVVAAMGKSNAEHDFAVVQPLKDDGDDSDPEEYSTDEDCETSSSDLSNYSVSYNIHQSKKIQEVEATTEDEDKKSGLFLSIDMVRMLRLSTSEGNLLHMLPTEVLQKMTPADIKAGPQQPSMPRRHSGGELPQQNRMVFALQTKSALESHAQHAQIDAGIPKPKEKLKSLLEARGITFTTQKSLDVKHLFTEGCVASHTLELMNAVRNNDMAVIRRLWEEGQNFQTCNRFGESAVHAAARRGNLQVLMFFKEMANVSLRCMCQQGRTPLHDACWTSRPEFGIIRYLLQDYPENLYLTDARGFTPLDFVPHDVYEEWNDFIEENFDLLCLPKGLTEA